MYNGAKLSEPIIILESDKKIQLKEKHTFFNTDVYTYPYISKAGQIDVFYHTKTFRLVGYREKFKEYVKVSDSPNYIIINYSVSDQIKNLGLEGKYINIENMKNTIGSKNFNINIIVNNLLRDHLMKIKNCLDFISAAVNQVKNNEQLIAMRQLSYKPSEWISIITKYKKSLNKINIESIFNKWYVIRDNIMFESVKNEIIYDNDNFINSNIVYDNNKSVHIILYYMSNELAKLIEMNNMNNTLATFIVELIDYLYKQYNNDFEIRQLELKRYNYILYGSEYLVDLKRKGHGLENAETAPETDDSGYAYPDEAVDTEEKDDNEESAQALDAGTVNYDGHDYVEDYADDYADGDNADEIE
jgi:hypothetical protein